MAAKRRAEPVREFQLEGMGLILVGALVVGGLVGAFFVGRWYERSRIGDGSLASSSANPIAHVELPGGAAGVKDVAESAGFFDVVEGGEKEVEPDREIARQTLADPEPAGERHSDTTPTPRAQRTAAPSADQDGKYFVQVFAGRDEKAAASLLGKLEAGGHPVRLHTDRQGSTTLYKVRVGGFATQDLARTAADTLQGQGYSGAWVTQVD